MFQNTDLKDRFHEGGGSARVRNPGGHEPDAVLVFWRQFRLVRFLHLQSSVPEKPDGEKLFLVQFYNFLGGNLTNESIQNSNDTFNK